MVTTGTNPDDGARRWAAGLLGAHESASPEEAGRAYLRKLREQEFMPPFPLHGALRVFQQQPLSAAAEEQVRVEEQTRLRAEVDAFANEFFRLPAAKRRERWNELLVRCRHLRTLSARLQDLNDGLDVDIGGVPMDESQVGKLAAHLVESFPLPRLGRAASRQAFLRVVENGTLPADRKSWEKTARYLRGEWPSVAALDYNLVKQLSSLRRRLRRRDKMEIRSRQRRFVRSDNAQKSDWRWLWLLVFIGGPLLRGITSTNSTNSPNPSSYAPPPPNYSPAFQEQFTRELVNAPISELLNPARFDVELLDAERVCFTARPGSAAKTPNDARPIVLGKATLMLMGVSKADIDALFTRAAKGRSPASSPSTRPKSPEPDIAKPSNRDKSRQ